MYLSYSLVCFLVRVCLSRNCKQFRKVFCKRLFTLTLNFFFARVKLEIYTTLNSCHPCSLVIHCFYHLRSLTRKPFHFIRSNFSAAVRPFKFSILTCISSYSLGERSVDRTDIVKNPYGSSDHDGRLLGLIFSKVINPVFGSQRTTLHLK